MTAFNWNDMEALAKLATEDCEEGDRIIMLTTHTGTVAGVQVAQHLGAVIDMRDGLMHRMRFEIGFDETLALAATE